jgi:hypothetical protein
MRLNQKIWLVLPAIILGLIDIATAVDRYVPSQYPTIQAAINASANGDTVFVAPGTYTGDGNRDIDFLGKAITVRSIDPNDPNVVAATIIDCNGTETQWHRGFYFHNGEDANSVVAGLTITNGYGPDELLELYQISYYSAGGAIFCNRSSPTVACCKIEGNRAKGVGGGMCNYHSSPRVSNCSFISNSAPGGAGMHNWGSSPKVTKCIFRDNSAGHSGGGIFIYGHHEDSPTVIKCTFRANSSLYYGGAVFNRAESNLRIIDCMFMENWARRDGGALHNLESSPIVANCIFDKSSAGENGGAMYNDSDIHNGYANPTIINCTFATNSAGFDGGGIYNHDGKSSRNVSNPNVTNCIFWDNRDKHGKTQSSQIYVPDDGAPIINYSCIEGWTGSLGGMGNFDADPAFVHPATDDYHLLPHSPCINAGDPNYVSVPEESDIDGDPRVLDGRIDMGVDEFILMPEPIIGVSPQEFEFSAYPDGANPENQILTIRNISGGRTLYWLVTKNRSWLEVYPDNGESTGDINEVTLSVNISGISSGLYSCELTIIADGIVNSPLLIPVTLRIFDDDGELHVPSEFVSIQAAIDTAIDGETVTLAPMTYTGSGNRDLDFKGKAISVRSTNPYDPTVVTATVINCQGTEAEPHRGFRFISGEGPDSIIAGLTITRGYGPNEPVGYMASAGGAIFCFTSNPTISLCVINDNYAGYKAGGIYCEECNPTIANCTFSRNSASYGCGIYCCKSSPTVINCTFTGNRTDYPGMGFGAGMVSAENSNPTITNCTFSGNFAHSQAGGLYIGDYCTPTVTNCIFSANSAGYGGGMYNGWYSTTKVSDCVFSGNLARDNGGAMLNSRDAEPIITNCTFTGNSAKAGGGMLNYHSIPTLTNCIFWGNLPNEIDGRALVRYSSIRGGWLGEGNIDEDPCFVEPESNDFHLRPDSPCINAGDPNFIVLFNEKDIDGELRVMLGRIDMGADEFNPFAVSFEVVSKRRISRMVFAYDCTVTLRNISRFSVRNVQLEIVNASENMVIIEPKVTYGDVEIGAGESATSIDTCTFQVDRSEAIEPAKIIWKSTCQMTNSGQEIQDTASGMGFLRLENNAGDSKVDLAGLVDKWLWTGDAGSIKEDVTGDGIVNLADFAAIAGK